MATPNVGILTNAGKKLIDRVNAGQTKITFSKIVFSSMNNNQLTDDQIKALTTVAPQEIVVNNPKVTLDNNTGETRIRATGNNKALNDGVYVKTYAVYAKDDSSNEILYGITVSPNPNYLPEYDGVTPQAVTYSYKVNISNTTKITFTNSNDVYVSDTDLDEVLQPYAKTVDVNQQLDKKVNIADMRKPASDVVGLEDVSTSVYREDLAKNTDLDTLTQEGLYNFGTSLVNFIDSDNHWGTIQVINKSAVVVQYVICTSVGGIQIYFRTQSGTSPKYWSTWTMVPRFNMNNSTLMLTNGNQLKLADDSKVVHNTDMRRPASNVAGIEEVNAKQDKIAYTPADDSKVIHSTDMRKPASDVVGLEDVSNGLYKGGLEKNTDLNTLTQEGIYNFETPLVNFIDSDEHWGTIYVTNKSGVVFQYVITTSRAGNQIFFRTKSGSPEKWAPWTMVSAFGMDNRLRLPNGEFLKPADDSKVAHLSGANNFDTVPTVKNNPLLLASSLPSDLARTGQANTFTANQTFSIAPTIKDASKDKGDNQAATMADLKSVKESAWRQLDSSLITVDSGVDGTCHTDCLYKIDPVNKKIYIHWIIQFEDRTNDGNAYLDFSSVVSNFISQGTGNMLFQVNSAFNGSTGFGINGSKISFTIPRGSAILASGFIEDCWFGYDTLLI